MEDRRGDEDIKIGEDGGGRGLGGEGVKLFFVGVVLEVDRLLRKIDSWRFRDVSMDFSRLKVVMVLAMGFFLFRSEGYFLFFFFGR